VHFKILNQSGPGDANMSSLFQAGLKGNELSKSPLNIAYGSIVTIKSRSHGGGLLHSHVQTFPAGSKQQQVTTYHHKDMNNDWYFVRANDPNGSKNSEEIVYVKDGDMVKLRHKSTLRNLHSHFVEAPITKSELEVSGFGNEEFEDPNDLWQVEIVSDPNPDKARQLRSLSTNFRLKHNHTGCYLKSRNIHLPEWGFKQGEVSCERNLKNPVNREILWNIESQVNEKLPAGELGQYKSRFLDDVWDCNVGMWMTNNALTQNPDLEPSILTSRASDWFFMRKGIRMSGWDDARTKFYMLGTPAVWLTGSFSIIIAALIIGAMIVLSKRQIITLATKGTQRFLYQSRIALGGWVLHYIPFFLIGRVLYLHHYYPSLTFAILAFGMIFDYATATISQKKRWVLFGICASLVLANYVYFSPLCYGMDGPAKKYIGRHWISTWNL
jgi:dolichyl-phosphate-mannose-protein mannosyltransferase